MNATRRRAGIGVMIAIVIMTLAAACQATRNVDKTGGDTAVLRLVDLRGASQRQRPELRTAGIRRQPPQTVRRPPEGRTRN